LLRAGLRQVKRGADRRGKRTGSTELSPPEPQLPKPVIGLVGGIGAGKSQVAGLLKACGCAVIDADRLCQELLDDPQIAGTLRQWWGERAWPRGGAVDRKAIADIVFRDEAELERLESLLYPKVIEKQRRLIEAHRSDPAVRAVVLDAPKLMEAGLDAQCDVVLYIEASPKVRAARLARSRGWSEHERARREKMQFPLDRKRARADYVIDNNSDTNELSTRIDEVLSQVLSGFTAQ